MQFEQISPETNLQHFEKRLQQLEQLILVLKKTTSRLPTGRLRLSQKSKHVEYYHVITKSSTLGTYIPRGKIKLASQLAQKDYNLRLIKLIENEISAIQNYLCQTENCRAIQNLYDRLNTPRQKLIIPVTLPDAQYIEKWKSVEWQGRPFSDNSPDLFTTNGERVRSKSEIQIADTRPRHQTPARSLANETKSRRVQLLIQPSLWKELEAFAAREGLSNNEAVISAIRAFVRKEK